MTGLKVIEIRGKWEDAVVEACGVLRGGGLVIYPTETCYALGANALDFHAVKTVYSVKRRPFVLPLPVIMADVTMWQRFAEFTPAAWKLIERFSPGPLTLVLKKKSGIPDILNPQSLAARVSSHPMASRLVQLLGLPVVSTSANSHGTKETYTVEDALNSLESFQGIALDYGRLPRQPVSTIVDLTAHPYELQRTYPQGAIKEDDIRNVLESCS